ncbi:ATP-grasp fold amidoligase family protein [Ruania albidiflava]|uniref:ATP-grasp fold amidoligase family protein n=1 Tax=Ruania albidiflava TaxID=366586 RepID=UPI0006869CF4|nr:ATP-grasp fold amidoligase family protein [Ruania albidiflava]
MRAAVERTFHPNLIAGMDPQALARRTESLRAEATPHHVSHRVLRRLERNRLGIRRSISFRAKVHEMSEARYLDGVLRPTWRLDTKNSAYNFVDAIGVRRPRSDKSRYSLADAPKDSPGVLKATRSTGSRGCYLIYSEDHIVHVRDGQTFESIGEMTQHAHKLMNAQRNPVRDNWMWEELILEDVANRIPARDLKFYAFYGEVVIVRESVRTGAETKVAYWDADTQQRDMGHPQDFDFPRLGFTPDEASLVSDISLQIPHPYARIDMLKSEDGLVVGEFTPRPGNFDEFNDDWDRILGEAWVRAESRLMADLLCGKSFQPFLEATNLLT